MQVATLTLKAIADAMEADGGNGFRARLAHHLPLMDDAYRQDDGGFRSHLGASLMGRECTRELQLGWRWAIKEKFPARVLRLFNRGHLEEARFLSMLDLVPGMKVYAVTEDGGQYKWSTHGGHHGSSLDGVVTGCPDIPNGAPAYAEFKTSAAKAFKDVVDKGVQAAKFEHYVQMQLCMKHFNLSYALYMMVHKDTDELHAEILTYDAQCAEQYTNRAANIIFATEPMVRVSNVETFFKCKYCSKRPVCHGKQIPLINCRTCAHWSANPAGGFTCERNRPEVNDKKACQAGCPDHVFDPTLLPAYSFMGGDAEGNFTILRTLDGVEFKQGPNHVSSQELFNSVNNK